MNINIFSEKTAKLLSWIGLLLILLSAFVFIFFRSWNFSFVLNEEKVAQFGDFIGGVVGSILAFAGVVLYYVALTEQRKDIAINREALKTQVKALEQQIKEFQAQTSEMQETRTVHEQQVKELKSQTTLYSWQRFNSEFYSLLNVFIDIKSNCKLTITEILEELKQKAPNIYSQTNSISNRHALIVKEFIMQYYRNADSISKFFKTLFHLLKLIDDSKLEPEEKYRYAKTLRSQLSENELLVTYYDYCSNLEDDAKVLVKKYDLLKDLHLVDRLENDTRAFEQYRTSVILYFSQLEKMLNMMIDRFRDLENDEDVDVDEYYPFVGIDSTYHLVITDKSFSFEIGFPKEQKLFKAEDLRGIFLVFLYDFFFMSKLRKLNEEQFSYTTKETEGKYIYEFKSNLDKLL